MALESVSPSPWPGLPVLSPPDKGREDIFQLVLGKTGTTIKHVNAHVLHALHSQTDSRTATVLHRILDQVPEGTTELMRPTVSFDLIRAPCK